MSDATSKSINLGFPFASILTIIFVIAKLTGHFAYSWWIVFAPFLISAGLGLLILGIVLLIGLIAILIAAYKS